MLQRFENQLRTANWRGVVKLLMIAAMLVLIGFLLKSVDFDGLFKSLPFTNTDAGWTNGKLAYLVFASLLVAVGCPRQVVSFFAAYYFGLWVGILLGVIATTLACILSFSIARIFQRYFKGFLKGKLKLAFEFWSSNTFFATMIWRFIPAGSNLLTNLVAGAFGISALPFIMGSAIGYIPHTVVFALLGAGVEVGSNFQILASGVLLGVSVLLGFVLFKKYRRQLSPT